MNSLNATRKEFPNLDTTSNRRNPLPKSLTYQGKTWKLNGMIFDGTVVYVNGATCLFIDTLHI